MNTHSPRPLRDALRALAFATTALACRPTPDPQATDLHSARDAARVLDSVIAVMGDVQALERFGPITIHATGHLDKTAEGQGFAPGIAAPGAFREVIAVDLRMGAVAVEYREDRSPSSGWQSRRDRQHSNPIGGASTAVCPMRSWQSSETAHSRSGASTDTKTARCCLVRSTKAR